MERFSIEWDAGIGFVEKHPGAMHYARVQGSTPLAGAMHCASTLVHSQYYCNV